MLGIGSYHVLSGIFQLFTPHHHFLTLPPILAPPTSAPLFQYRQPAKASVHSMPCTSGSITCAGQGDIELAQLSSTNISGIRDTKDTISSGIPDPWQSPIAPLASPQPPASLPSSSAQTSSPVEEANLLALELV